MTPPIPAPAPAPAKRDQASGPSSLFARALVAGLLVLNLVVAAIGLYSLRQSRTHHDERAAITTRNLSQILDENLTGMLAKVDLALLAVVDEAEHQLTSGDLHAAQFSGVIIREHDRLPELTAFRATDASGDAIYGPTTPVARTSSLAHRDYFRRHRENPGAGLLISEPLVGGISGKWLVILSRRYNRPDGTFAGLVYAGVSLESLSRTFSQLDVGTHGGITLLDPALTIVARHPDDPAQGNLVGRSLKAPGLIEALKGGGAYGTFLDRSPLDGLEKVVSYRRIGGRHPFLITVALARLDYLQDWRSEFWKLSAFITAFHILSILSAILIYREWLRSQREFAEQERAHALLNAQKEELEATLARTKRLEGLISICMHCKKINNQADSWDHLEKYLSEHTDAMFSHGICPDCHQEHYPAVPRRRDG